MSAAAVIPEELLAGLLLVGGVLAAGPLSILMSTARWPRRAPGPALVVWQALCLAAGLCVVGAFVVIAVRPWGDDLFSALVTGWRQVGTGHPLAELGPLNIGAGVIAVAVALYLLVVMTLTAVQTLRQRQRHRRMLDLIGNRSAGFDVLDSIRPIAYSLPGIKPRVVLSAGLLTALDDDQARAAIEHERAHLRVRHDLLLLPFGAWARALRWIPGVREGRTAVADLAEMHADDVAVRRVPASVLAAALAAVAMAGDPGAQRDSDPGDGSQDDDGRAHGSLGTEVDGNGPRRPGRGPDAARPSVVEVGHSSSVAAVAMRVRRLLDPNPLGSVGRIGVYGLAFALLAIPTGLLLIGWT